MTGTLLAYASQGHGDAIQMARYLPELATRCPRLIVMVHGSLVKLFERQARGRWRVMALDAETPEHDAYVDMMSLPFLLGTDEVGKIPPPADFDVLKRPQYDGRLALVVGLCTQGGKVASLDLDRSDHTGALAGLKQVLGTLAHPVHWIDFTGRTGDWALTAIDVASCDLLVSVDSALAHLAGSLGVETWLIPPTHFEHRWSPPHVLEAHGVRRDGSFWYPQTHTLYRRKRTNDWAGVTARIRTDLEARIA